MSSAVATAISHEWSRKKCHESSEQWNERPRSNNQTQHPHGYKNLPSTSATTANAHYLQNLLQTQIPPTNSPKYDAVFLFHQVRTFVSVSRIFETLDSFMVFRFDYLCESWKPSSLILCVDLNHLFLLVFLLVLVLCCFGFCLVQFVVVVLVHTVFTLLSNFSVVIWDCNHCFGFVIRLILNLGEF